MIAQTRMMVSLFVMSRNKHEPTIDSMRPSTVVTSTAPQTGSKRRRDAEEDEDVNMEVDDFGQRKKARSREPDTPVTQEAPKPWTVADAADAARDASPFPVSRTASALEAVEEVTDGVNDVELEGKTEAVTEVPATAAATVDKSDEEKEEPKSAVEIIKEHAMFKDRNPIPADDSTPAADPEQKETKSAVDIIREHAVTKDKNTVPADIAASGPISRDDSKDAEDTTETISESKATEDTLEDTPTTATKTDNTSSSSSKADPSVVSTSEASTAVASNDPTDTTEEPVKPTTDAIEEAPEVKSKSQSTTVQSSASPEPLPAVTKA
jgi:hypothetical protein